MTIIFDLGGVIITLEHKRAVQRFVELGIKDADRQLDPYTQGGPFGALEQGLISTEDFRLEMCRQTGRDVTADECAHAWMGYMGEVPAYKLDSLNDLRRRGYRLILLSNTNPFIAQWLQSPAFDGRGNSIGSYFDATYMSFDIRMMKPDLRVFQLIEEREALVPNETVFLDDGPRNIAAAAARGWHTIQPTNGSDWRADLERVLSSHNSQL